MSYMYRRVTALAGDRRFCAPSPPLPQPRADSDQCEHRARRPEQLGTQRVQAIWLTHQGADMAQRPRSSRRTRARAEVVARHPPHDDTCDQEGHPCDCRDRRHQPRTTSHRASVPPPGVSADWQGPAGGRRMQRGCRRTSPRCARRPVLESFQPRLAQRDALDYGRPQTNAPNRRSLNPPTPFLVRPRPEGRWRRSAQVSRNSVGLPASARRGGRFLVSAPRSALACLANELAGADGATIGRLPFGGMV
jgi:hypothetical protein